MYSYLPTIQIIRVQSFSPGVCEFATSHHRHAPSVLTAKNKHTDGDEYDNGSCSSSSLSSYNDSDGASKGIVSSLTGIVNALSGDRDSEVATRMEPSETPSRPASIIGIEKQRDPSPTASSSLSSSSAPKSAQELLERIRKDYEERNYLWTGDLDLDCFYEDCVFTDPTISFVGTDKFTENTQNLVPIVEAFAEDYRSELLSISLGTSSKSSNNKKDDDDNQQQQQHDDDDDDDDFYVETRWNMVGSLTASPWLFWKPKIDVIGRTKFWFRQQDPDDSDSGGGRYRIYFYDESWEIAAWKALLQIVTPAGTFPSSSSSSSTNIK